LVEVHDRLGAVEDLLEPAAAERAGEVDDRSLGRGDRDASVARGLLRRQRAAPVQADPRPPGAARVAGDHHVDRTVIADPKPVQLRSCDDAVLGVREIRGEFSAHTAD